MLLDEWAAFYGIHPVALADLKDRMGISAPTPMPPMPGGTTDSADAPGSEGRQQSLVRIEAANLRVRLFRNNSGALRDETGRMVRFGLANESKAINEVLKSPDLIGWRPRLITAAMVGMTIGQCTMREMKHEGWSFNPNDPHEVAQLAFLNLALADGCDAGFATGPGTL